MKIKINDKENIPCSTSANATRKFQPSNNIQQFIFPTLEMCKKLQEEKKIRPGGRASGAVRRVLIMSAGSVQGLNDVITSLPL